MEHDVYISYSAKNNEVAQMICRVLEQNEIKCWMAPRNMPPGSNYRGVIKDAIENSKFFVVILSSACQGQNTWMEEEISMAIKAKIVNSGIKILPINIDGKFDAEKITSSFFREIANYQWLDFNTSDFFVSVSRLISTIKGKDFSEHQGREIFLAYPRADKNTAISRLISTIKGKDFSEHQGREIFLAYPRADKNTAIKVSSILEKNGFSVWQDLDGINTCDEFAHVIMKAIDEAKVFLLIESKWSRNSEWVKREVEYATSKKKHIVKILTDNPKGLSGVRRMNFSPNLLEVGTKLFEEKLLAVVLSKGCNSDTSVISKEGERFYNEVNEGFINPIGTTQKKDLEKKSFSLFLRAVELGDENAQMYIDCKSWNINLIECVNQYNEIYSNFINDLREGIYNKGIIIAEDETLTDSSQRGRGMERAAFKFMKRAINLGYAGNKPEDYDWYFLEENDFKICNDTLGFSSTYPKKTEKEIKFGSHKPNTTLYVTDLNSSSDDANSYTAFLSYSSDDKETIQKVYDMLKMSSYRPWMAPQDIVPGKPYAKSIIEGIKECPIFLIFVSSSAMNSDNVLSEVEKAHKERKVVLPIFIEDVKLNDELEYYLARKQWIKAFGQIEDFYNLIIDSIKENLK